MSHRNLPMLRGKHLDGSWLRAAFLLLAVAFTECSPEQVVGTNLPPDVPDPKTTHTPAGAVAAYQGAIVLFRNAFGGDYDSFVPISGLLTDEIRLAYTDVGLEQVDSRSMEEANVPGSIDRVYSLLQQARGQSEEALGLLHAYAPDSAALIGHLDAVKGYTEIFLGDLFCSGIPLSTLDYNGDFTYEPGSNTAQVYTSAAALFDSALTLVASSDPIANYARLGKGRALLALGQYAAAAQAVTSVPNGYSYKLAFSAAVSGGPSVAPNANRNYLFPDFAGDGGTPILMTLVDGEGGNGMRFLSSGDPRTPWISRGTNNRGEALTAPAEYGLSGDSSVAVASAVEARLIQSEAALQAGDTSWLTTLNALRTDGTFTTQPDPSNPAQTDTIWSPGSGGVADLKPLTDPGSTDSRVDLLFQERAFWLFLTGHRQGDLRRLIRQYGRDPERVYPIGVYQSGGVYGSDVTAPIPQSEKVSNPLFSGCLNRGA